MAETKKGERIEGAVYIQSPLRCLYRGRDVEWLDTGALIQNLSARLVVLPQELATPEHADFVQRWHSQRGLA